MEALKSWQEEKRSAYLYNQISNIEKNPVHKKLFQQLSAMADNQAAIWEKQLRETRVKIPKKFHPDGRTRIVIWLVQCFGASALRIALAAMKIRGMSIYQSQYIGQQVIPTVAIETEERRHRGVKSGNNIRAAIFGMNDGLISNASLIFGMAGAHAGHSIVLLSGIAGLIAGACSMGAGEYISVRSQREMLEYQLLLEKSELELYPEEEAAELALIYQARGLPKNEAEKVANLLIKNPEKALDTLAREELGIDPTALVSPWGAAIFSFVSFSIGALIPLLPFMLGEASFNLLSSIGLTGLSLFTVGATLSLFTQRNALWSGLRMLLIGSAAGCLTYLIGTMLGVNV